MQRCFFFLYILVWWFCSFKTKKGFSLLLVRIMELRRKKKDFVFAEGRKQGARTLLSFCFEIQNWFCFFFFFYESSHHLAL